MFGTNFYHESLKRYVAVFGTIFNDIQISRKDNSSNTVQTLSVPINYGPIQKFLARLVQDPNLTAPAITLPRMSFEITDMRYDGSRKLTNMTRNYNASATDPNQFTTMFTPAPYNLEFELNLMTKYIEDGNQIVEQILPYFKPEFTPTVRIVDDLPIDLDIPIILNSVKHVDTYDEGNFENRRALIWTFNFTMKAYFFGPSTPKKIIKFAQSNMYYDTNSNTNISEVIVVQPGLDANGNPTTSLDNTIPYSDINFNDNWDYIVKIEDYNG
jgi:hypothetical protein